jgi:hypothetical protein
MKVLMHHSQRAARSFVRGLAIDDNHAIETNDVGCINIQQEIIVSTALSPLTVNSDQIIINIVKAANTTNTRSKLHRRQRPLNNPKSCKKAPEIVILDPPPQSRSVPKTSEWIGQLPLIETPKSINQVPSRNRFQSKLSFRNHSNGSQQRQPPFSKRPQNRRPPRHRGLDAKRKAG